jgi:ABC-type nitrate/sulfonate/bicarbonate transport system substrate-binding protein
MSSIEDLKKKLAMTENALVHATSYANANPKNAVAKSIKDTLLMRQAVLTSTINKQTERAACRR